MTPEQRTLLNRLDIRAAYLNRYLSIASQDAAHKALVACPDDPRSAHV